MTVQHEGAGMPELPYRWDQYDVDVIWFAWDDVLNGSTIQTSTFVIGANWTEVETYQSQSITDEAGTTFSAANGILASTTDTSGIHTISNRVTLSDGRQYERSVRVRVAQQ